MHNSMAGNMRLVISFGAACIGCLATALLALPATADTNGSAATGRWTAIGPLSGNTSNFAPFAVDPSSPSTIYSVAGTSIMKTNDGGGHWAVVADDSKQFQFLVVDPVSSTTIYAIGGGPGSFGSIYKSIDGGVNWTAVSNTLLTSPINVLAIAPSRRSTLYAGSSSKGILKSIDGGLSWLKINNGLPGLSVWRLAIDPTDADVVYMAAYPTAAGGAKIFKSTDGGGQWRQLPISFPAEAIVSPLAIDPMTPSVVYAAYAVLDGSDFLIEAGLFKSIDSGETWFAAQNPPSDINALAIDPSAPGRIYANNLSGVFASTDAAATWTPINSGLPNLVWGLSIDRTGSSLRTASTLGLFEYRIGGPPPSATVPVIEYYDAAFDHYFITSNPDEIRKLDSEGSTGWVRTGFQFNAYAAPNGDSTPVCRFFSVAFGPKSSHFFTPFAAECATRQSDPAWILESADAFDLAVPAADGTCALGLTPVYRWYNNGQGGAPNHRYTTEVRVRGQMLVSGWVPEGLGANGVEMCSPL